MVQTLIEKGADVNAKNAAEATPIFDAAENDHPSIVKLLIDNHADIAPVDNLDTTPFEYALKKGNYFILKEKNWIESNA